jgi:hypothetical protein
MGLALPLEFLSRLGNLIPWYIRNLLQLMTEPRTFFYSVANSESDCLSNALLFYALSVVISIFVAMTVDRIEADFMTEIVISETLHVVTVVFCALVAYLAWHISMSPVSLRDTLAALFYIYGVTLIIAALSGVMARSIMKIGRPEDYALFNEYMDLVFLQSSDLYQRRFQALADSRHMLAAMVALGTGYLVMLIWLLVSWISFGRAQSVGPLRSVAALFLFILLSYYPLTYGITRIYIASGTDPF